MALPALRRATATATLCGLIRPHARGRGAPGVQTIQIGHDEPPTFGLHADSLESRIQG